MFACPSALALDVRNSRRDADGFPTPGAKPLVAKCCAAPACGIPGPDEELTCANSAINLCPPVSDSGATFRRKS